MREKYKETDKHVNGYDDGMYNLVIGKYSDGSGGCAELCRYAGNAELLDVIIKTLEIQLENFEHDFKEL